MPRFSVIVPVYNVEKYLDECVQSVINQSFTDWELILVDDGSTDNSSRLCDKYAETDKRISVIHKSNGGLSDARNAGLDVCCGDYILMLDSDDFYNDTSALKHLNTMIDSKNTDVILFGCTDWNMKTNETVVSRNGYDLNIISTENYDKTLHYLLSSKMIPGGSTIFCVRRDIIEKNGIRFKVGIQDEDYDYVLGVFTNASSICALNNPFYVYRQGRADSITGSSSIKMIYGIEYTINKWIPIALNIENEVLKRDYLNYIAFIYSTGFVVCGRMKKDERKESIKIMNKYKSVLKFAYWKKPKITAIAIKLIGLELFSILATKYYDKTHIQTVNV